MALRNFYVVVDPTSWNGSVSDLADALAGVTGAKSTQLERMLQRGQITVESDLSTDDADALRAKLQKKGITAEVRNDDHSANAMTVQSDGPRVTTRARAEQERIVGRTLKGTYEVQAKIGEGGMGDVYRAVQHPLEREVAIKIVSIVDDDPDAEHYFIREVQTINALRHPNIVAIQDFGHEDDFLFLVMEFLPGETLAEVMTKEFPLDPRRICKVCIQILKALEQAHDKGVIHCDLKPANIMLETVAGESDFVKILDFGVAKYTSPEVEAGPRTNKGNIVGTFDYMSPEQLLRGDVDARADIWALGVVLYEILTGERPFHDRNPAKIIAQVLQRDPVAPSQLVEEPIAPQIERITLKALNRDVRDRFQSAADMRAAFEAAEFELKTGVVSLDDLEGRDKKRTATQAGFHQLDEPRPDRQRVGSDVNTENLGKAGWGALFPNLDSEEPQVGSVPDVFSSDQHELVEPDSEAAKAETTDSNPEDAKPAAGDSAWPEALKGAGEPGPTIPDEPDERPSSRDSDFDAAVLHAASPTNRDEPPFKPKGFDKEADHLPVVAVLLSVIAPGAGQVYNGQDGLALGYGLKFFMVKPWLSAGRQAKARADKIATYYAPRPPSGAGLRALRYVFGWQLAVWAIVIMSAWLGGKVIQTLGREDVPERTAQDITRSFEQAEIDVQEARLAGLDALAEEQASGRIQPEQRFTMEKKERVARLFALGYVKCVARDVTRCEHFMRQVLELTPGHSDAIKLQAWASFSRNSSEKRPLPIINVQTLAEIEAYGVKITPRILPKDAPAPQPPEPETPAIQRDVGISPPTKDAQ